ncbi:MAG: amino acid racemase [Bacteroidota bacterium]
MTQRARPVIGVVGGMGPQAGLDLAQKVLAHTVAATDQDHVPTLLLSHPDRIVDRTEYLLGHIAENPAPAILEVLLALDGLGATVAGMACNTAHAPVFFDALQAGLRDAGAQVRLLHLVDEAARFVRTAYPAVRRVGVLSTTGTQRLGLYPEALRRVGLEAVVPDAALQNRVHAAIYDPLQGIKAQSHPVTPEAQATVMEAARALQTQGAEALLLGCTELPLALTGSALDGLPLIDPTRALARALLRETYPEKLRPW